MSTHFCSECGAEMPSSGERCPECGWRRPLPALTGEVLPADPTTPASFESEDAAPGVEVIRTAPDDTPAQPASASCAMNGCGCFWLLLALLVIGFIASHT